MKLFAAPHHESVCGTTPTSRDVRDWSGLEV